MKLLLALLIILLLVWHFWPEPEPVPVEESFISDQVKVLEDMQSLETDLQKADEARRRRLEEEIEKQSGGG